jgi:hypothetical protein
MVVSLRNVQPWQPTNPVQWRDLINLSEEVKRGDQLRSGKRRDT